MSPFDLLNEVNPFCDLAKAGVAAVEVGGVLAVVDDEELRAAGVAGLRGHAQRPCRGGGCRRRARSRGCPGPPLPMPCGHPPGRQPE